MRHLGPMDRTLGWIGVLVFFVCRQVWGEVKEEIVVHGNKLFEKSGSEFQVRGMFYTASNASPGSGFDASPGSGFDMLSNFTSCYEDALRLLGLQVNLIWVWGLDPNLDHRDCMDVFQSHNIFVAVGLLPFEEFGSSIDPLSRAPQVAYDTTTYNRTKAVIENMGEYPNMFGFIVPLPRPDMEERRAIPLTKAIIRDAKSHIKSKIRSNLLVGTWFPEEEASTSLLDYFACDDSRSDFFAISRINTINDCASRVITQAWIEDNAKTLSGTSTPVILTGIGCNNWTDFDYIHTLYSREIANVLVGGVFYNYVDIDKLYLEGNVNYRNESYFYNNLSSVMDTRTTSVLPRFTTLPPTKTTACPTKDETWQIAATLPPTPDESMDRVCKCMMARARCVANDGVVERNDDNVWDNPIFQICGNDLKGCNGIASDVYEGRYGAFSGCSYSERISWVLSDRARRNSSFADCYVVPGSPREYGGWFRVQKNPVFSPECDFLLNQAGPEGTGTITNFDFAKSTGPPLPKNNPDSTKGGLSVAAKAGIGLGISIAVIAGLFMALFLLHRKNKASKVDGSSSEPGHPAESELHGGVHLMEKEGMSEAVEVPALNSTAWELHGNALTGELPGGNPSQQEESLAQRSERHAGFATP